MGISVLCAEPDPIVGRYIRQQLGRRGVAVHLVADVSAVLEYLSRDDVDVAVLNAGLQDRCTSQLVETVKTAHPNLPMIALIGAGDGTETLRAGADDCLTLDLSEAFISALEASIRICISVAHRLRRQESDHRDVRDARDRFEALAAERQILLHEVNHRVGNSLQLVGAFLHMQASSSSIPETRLALDEANRRVIAIAQLHKRLYATDDVQSIALHQYLNLLVDDIRLSTDGAEIGDLLSIAVDEVSIDPDSAVTIGIIVTELVINAMKYAYPGSRGPIRVALHWIAPSGTLRLAVDDDGVGAGQQRGSPTGIGRTIISAMATKLGSMVDYNETTTGTRASMTFQPPPRVHVPGSLVT